MIRTSLLVASTIAIVATASAFLRNPARAAIRSEEQEPIVAGLRSFDIVSLETVAETSSNASIGDMNGDGCPDILLVKGRHWALQSVVLFGDCKGHFTPGPRVPAQPTKSYSGSLADMTHSGNLDIVLSNDSPEPKLILLNDGHGHFSGEATYGESRWPTRNAAVGDLNGGGYPDIVVANRMVPSYVCLNDHKLHFDCQPLPDSQSAATVAIGDISGSGKKDIIYACRDSCQSLVYFNDGKGHFDRHEPWGPARSSTRALAVGDFNGDGHLDIAACHEILGCFVYLNDGKGSFGSGILFEAHRGLPYSMTTGDLLRRHRADIIVGHVGTPGVIYLNDGSGKKFEPMAFGDGKGTIYGMAVGDLNGDGWPDIVVARSDAPSFVMYSHPPKK